ncbi:NAD kinase [Rickettsiales endosymbiont of Stachyamoeba lipophora]|uniref:NAD kinase n=1 Tax=Rickettsiales endosymbiont of Stachyamoeba lipophora TaxID=2486578 RepID=UPI000F6540C8|nr:NAD kinase [Rickettsiales endosymbiont of Stachyamoeba lipophora]AZL14994.1 NAD kinase [Rickettsiales endosymbiont of Stachyamoeba lipophora]
MNIYCIADKSLAAQAEYELLKKTYPQLIFEKPSTDEEAILIVLGGDGYMLYNLHRYMHKPYKFYGMNCGTVGFLLNKFLVENLIERIKHAETSIINPLTMIVETTNNQLHELLAINEASLFRHTHQAAHLKLSINNQIKMDELVADGILVATPAGSSAYNASAGGPIIPLNAPLLALTPLNSYKPRRWGGALIPDTVKIQLEVLYSDKRPVIATADFQQIEKVKSAKIYQNNKLKLKLLFDPGHSLEERIINEQFLI